MKVLIVCARRYNGHELWTALGTLQKMGHEFEVISTDTLIADEITGRPNIIERTIDDVAPEDLDEFDGLMIVSGNMDDTEAYWYNDRVLSYVKKTNEANKPLAAICCSVPTIRQVAQGKKVSFYPLVRSRALLEREGAILETVSISVDGNLVTAEHQMATQTWAELFCELLEGNEVDAGLVDSGFTPKGKSERRLHPTLERLRGVDYHPKNKRLMGIEDDHDQ